MPHRRPGSGVRPNCWRARRRVNTRSPNPGLGRRPRQRNRRFPIRSSRQLPKSAPKLKSRNLPKDLYFVLSATVHMKAGIKRKLADTGSAEAEPVSAAAAGGSPGAKHKSSSKATKETLDRSAYVPTATVEKHNWASSSMREYAKEVEDELLYSGLALIHIPVNSRGSELGNVQRLGEMGPLVDLLEQARPGKMATYRYSFEEVSKGAYKIKYKTMGEGWRASKWYEHSEVRAPNFDALQRRAAARVTRLGLPLLPCLGAPRHCTQPDARLQHGGYQHIGGSNEPCRIIFGTSVWR